MEKVVNDLISDLSLKEKNTIANMELSTVESLDFIFDSYIKTKTGIGPEDKEEYSLIVTGLWERLQDTHKLKIVK